MNLRRRRIGTFILALLFLPALTCFALEEPNRAATSKPDYTVTLRYGKQRALAPEAIQALYSKAIEVLESSNFNSRAPRWQWNISKLHQDYRETVAGKYLLISFPAPQKMKTVGGEISVREILIGLNRSDYASSLFTIDDEGRIVGHGKYSGGLCIELLQVVKKIAHNV